MPFLSIRGYAFVRCAVRRLRRDDRRRGALVDMLPGPRGKRGAHGPIREPAGRPTSRIPGNRSRTERGWAVMRGRARPHHRGLPVEPKTRGAWVVHHADKLERVVNRTDFENIEHAGKAGQFLSARRVLRGRRLSTTASFFCLANSRRGGARGAASGAGDGKVGIGVTSRRGRGRWRVGWWQRSRRNVAQAARESARAALDRRAVGGKCRIRSAMTKA